MNNNIIALTRKVSGNINQCELTHLDREAINVELAREQHHHYEQALTTLGCQVVSMPEQQSLPDAVFIEDTAIILDEIAVITRPGAVSRREETFSVAEQMRLFRQLATIKEPGTLEGGDVLRLGKNLYVGVSARSNLAGIKQLQTCITRYGYTVHAVQVTGCLHLKSAVSQVSLDTVLVNPSWVDPDIFDNFHHIMIDQHEPYAANALFVNESVIYPTAYPQTMEYLITLGFAMIAVDVSEIIKAEGAVTCCSLIFKEILST